MDTLVLAGVVVVALFLLLALFARGGATEPVTPSGVPAYAAGIAKLTLPELASITSRLFNELGARSGTDPQHRESGHHRIDDPRHDRPWKHAGDPIEKVEGRVRQVKRLPARAPHSNERRGQEHAGHRSIRKVFAQRQRL